MIKNNNAIKVTITQGGNFFIRSFNIVFFSLFANFMPDWGSNSHRSSYEFSQDILL